VHIYPNRFVHNSLDLSYDELYDFAQIYLDVCKLFRPMSSGPLPYISALHNTRQPTRSERAYFHVETVSIRAALCVENTWRLRIGM